MLQNAYLLAKIGADTAENERSFAENLPKIGNSALRETFLAVDAEMLGEAGVKRIGELDAEAMQAKMAWG